jgi:hypothetical protein
MSFRFSLAQIRLHLQILIADFFFILFVLLWFVAGLAQKATGSSQLLDTWYSLWNVVFQPALGVLMLGALMSGAAGKLSEKKDS